MVTFPDSPPPAYLAEDPPVYDPPPPYPGIDTDEKLTVYRYDVCSILIFKPGIVIISDQVFFVEVQLEYSST